ncbi:hypothetical protein D3C71_1435790 [compost metagenome]
MARASSCAWPASTRRPAAQRATNPCVCSTSWPCGCRVFQGVPSPVSKPAGHWLWPSATVSCMRAQPRWAWACKGLGVQQLADSCARTPLHVGRNCQSTRPGRAVRSLLALPPVSTSCADPAHTVPRGCSSKSCPPVAWATPSASQRAGAKATIAGNTPSKAPTSAQPHTVRGAVTGADRVRVLRSTGCEGVRRNGEGAEINAWARARRAPQCHPSGRARRWTGRPAPQGWGRTVLWLLRR